MTFKINNIDCSGYITRYGYGTTYNPVFSESVVTMDGVEHVTVKRYKGTLTVTLRPLTGTQWATLSALLATGILTVQYTCIQRNTDVTASMKLDNISADMVLKNATRTLYGDTQLTFVEL